VIGQYVVCEDLPRKEIVVVARDGTVTARYGWDTPYCPDAVRARAFKTARMLADAERRCYQNRTTAE
jgi:hypothetical protein